MSMSVYIHYEGTNPHTELIENCSMTVSDALRIFCAGYKTKYPAGTLGYSLDRLELHPYGAPTAVLPQSAVLSTVCSDGDDLVVVVRGGILPPPPIVQQPIIHQREAVNEPPVTAADAVQQAEKWIAAKQYARALQVYEQLLPLIEPALRAHVYAKVASIHNSTGNMSKAVENFEKAILFGSMSKMKEVHEYRILLARLLCDGPKQYRKALEALSSVDGEAKNTKEFYLSFAVANYWLGNQKVGAETMTALVKAAPEYTDALMAYCRIYSHQRMYSDAMSLAIRLLVANNTDKKVKSFFAEIFRADPEGLRTLRQCLDTADNPEADKVSLAQGVGYLAMVLKDSSESPAGAALYLWSCEMDPANRSYVLNYLHTLEIDLEYTAALHFVRGFLERNLDVMIGEVSCKAVLQILENTQESSSTPARTAPLQKTSFPVETLNLMAIYFTIVKIKFIMGDVVSVQRLVSLLRHLTTGQDLHLTLIRNEAAYFTCIGELAASVSPFPLSAAPSETIYVCGDSHSLSPSWRTLKGGKVILRNALVTGLKCWHLREDTDFYPKRNFYQTMSKIPDGANVIMIFGEIDCREGLVQAVERARYATITEGMHVVIGIYINVLKELRTKRRFNFYIHPPMPTIEVTRHLVLQFNDILKAEVQASGFQYLDLLTRMCEGPVGQQKLKDIYTLDGVHVHPRYLDLLEEELFKEPKVDS